MDTAADHPLIAYKIGGVQCSSNSDFLRGLLRSIGLDGAVSYYWSGTPSKFQLYYYEFLNDPACRYNFQVQADVSAPNGGADPHFRFHPVLTELRADVPFLDGKCPHF
jgi:hypothetical protein